ncbi:NAD(P)/FAD-dependent oxidoreductase [Cohnella soli]|uniref:NAD(P)/FAD-dependent oxidoreductase n=1 Tax=Cohnella soli TaxID=425005 RepID=A0ABW0I391_9BACL
MHDAIIVGARCAGAALAVFLGKLGYRVLLLDKYASPGPVLSTHIIGEVEVYERLGILANMHAAGAPLITRMRVDLHGSVLESRLAATTRVLGLRRELLDPMLLKAAALQSNVDVLLNTEFIDVVEENGVVTGVVCRSDSGELIRHTAKVVIGADGRNSTVARRMRVAATRSATYSHAVCYFYARSVSPLAIPTVEWYWHDGGVAIINPIDQSMHCIALMIPSETMRSWQHELHTNAMNWLREIPTLKPRLERCSLSGKVKGLDRIEGYLRPSYGAGWALVGDAGAHLHPVAGVGIDNAVCCAEYLAESLHQVWSGQQGWEQAMASYAYRRDERIIPQYEASWATLAKAAETVDSKQLEMLEMLCTFPSLVKSLAQRADNIYANLTREVIVV